MSGMLSVVARCQRITIMIHEQEQDVKSKPAQLALTPQ